MDSIEEGSPHPAIELSALQSLMECVEQSVSHDQDKNSYCKCNHTNNELKYSEL